jgi:long-chain acyl-CoA synthetase
MTSSLGEVGQRPGAVERPWLKHYPDGVDWNTHFEAKPLYALADEAVAKFPDKPAVEFLGRRFTYAEIGRMIDQAADGFQRLGVRKGTHVGLYLPNCPQFIVCYFAILKAGGTVVNFSPLYSEPELVHQAEDSKTEIMVTLDVKALYPKALTVLKTSCVDRLVVGNLPEVLPFPKNLLYPLVQGKTVAEVEWDSFHTRFADLVDNRGQPDPVDINPHEDLAVLQYTGGTTGVAKGASLTHSNVYINACQTALWFQGAGAHMAEERIMGVLPLFHAFAMTCIMNVGMRIAAEIVLHPRFHLKDVMADIAKKKPSVLCGVPTMFTAILHSPDIARRDISSLKYCFSGGAPLPLEIIKSWQETTGGAIFEGYGLSECSPVATANPVSRMKAGSIGLPLPQTDIVITDKDNPQKILGVGETGEINIVGPQVMKGYWNQAAETAKTIMNGRLRTGDVGYTDEDGYTFIIDRMKDMILVSGFNVFPRVVEEALYAHPSVAEAIVIGIPDEYHGEVPKAFVKLKDPNDKLTSEELITFLRKRLGKHEIPAAIEFRKELPKTLVGKLSKKELVDEEREKRESAKQQA